MSNFSADRITIWCTKRQSIEQSLFFEVRVQVELANRQVTWSMIMLPGQTVPIQLLDIPQQVVLIAGENELLIDSSGLDRAFTLQFHEETSDQHE